MCKENIYDLVYILKTFDFDNEKIDSKTFIKIKNLIMYEIKHLIIENKKDKRYYNFIKIMSLLFNSSKDKKLNLVLKNAIENTDYENRVLIELKKHLNNESTQKELKKIIVAFIYVALMDYDREQLLTYEYGKDKIESISQKYQSYQKTINIKISKIEK